MSRRLLLRTKVKRCCDPYDDFTLKRTYNVFGMQAVLGEEISAEKGDF